MDGTIEARPEWKELLDRIRQGETVTVTEGGKPIAQVRPVAAARAYDEAEVARLVGELRAVRARNRLGDVTWQGLRDAGRR
jgi:prevent-host-death family protein